MADHTPADDVITPVHLAPADLLGARQWDEVVLTTFSLSLSFFEAIALDALTRQNSKPPLVLADVQGVRGALSEYGARVVGKDYEIEPVWLETGVLHAKVAALIGEGDAHLIVGSGNLTFSGWGGNLEVFDHLHPSFAANAFKDAGGFFRALADAPRARHGARDRLLKMATALEAAADGHPANDNIRLIHNIRQSLTAQLAGFAASLGGATDLVMAAPYWDNSGVDDLCAALGLGEAHLHAHPFAIAPGGGVDNWPRQTRTAITPIAIDWLAADQAKRTLHAKVLEIRCQNGRVVMSGSANGTRPALGPAGNIEAAVVRLFRDKASRWSVAPADVPNAPIISSEDPQDESSTIAVLRARMSGGHLEGRVLTPFPAGPADLTLVVGPNSHMAGEVIVQADGCFRTAADMVEARGWGAGRVLLRLSCGERQAEGFVSFADLAEIRGRAGPVAGRLLSVLSRTDTPEDAAAIMSWVWQNPRGLMRPNSTAGLWKSGDGQSVPHLADVQALLHGQTPGNPSQVSPPSPYSAGDRAWRRFIDNLFATFATPRQAERRPNKGQEEDDEDDGSSVSAEELEARRKTAEDRRRRRDAAERQAFANFEAELARTLQDPTPEGLVLLFALAQYLCDLLDADFGRTQGYLAELTAKMLSTPAVEPDALCAALTVQALCDVSLNPAARARTIRRRLHRRQISVEGACPDLSSAAVFLARLCPGADVISLWRDVQAARTLGEEIQSLSRALGAEYCPDKETFPLLQERTEWPRLERALAGDLRAKRSIYIVRRDALCCPCSWTALPTGARYEIQQVGITTAPGCDHILLSESG